ncbi:endospore germination permease [Paenibacillus sp. P25]|nr:endospore germination permease [Paenibacillus sp. P25]
MKKYAYNEITFLQFVFIINNMTVSIGFLAAPRVLAEQAGTDGWITLILGWSLTVAASLIVVQVMKRCPDGTLLDLLTRLWGKWAGKAGAVLLALYFFYYGYVGLVYTILILKTWPLPMTPAYLIMLLLLIPTYMITRNGVRILGRYAELILFISLWIPFVYMLPLKEVNWLYLLPVLKEGWKPILTGVPTLFYYNIGFATTFILYPPLKDKRKASAALTLSSTLTMLSYLFVTLACFVYFSPDEITEFNEPGIFVLKAIEFKYIERIEVTFIAFYLLIFSMSWIPLMYLTSYCTSWMARKQDHRVTICGWLCCCSASARFSSCLPMIRAILWRKFSAISALAWNTYFPSASSCFYGSMTTLNGG